MRKPTLSRRMRVFSIATALVASSAVAVGAWSAQADDLPACPEIFGHGGYPTGSNPWERDQIRQPNNPTALKDQKSNGASGVEADLQLTRDGHKAVMFHNDTTWALTGSNAQVNSLWWDTGANKLNGRTIEVGPFKGERVYTLRQYLDAAADIGIVPMIELKGTAEQSLLNSDAAIRDGAWSEVLDPISERIDKQEIILYTHDEKLKKDLASRIADAGLDQIQHGGPVWPDTVDWEEPPPAADGNFDSWQKALDAGPKRMATSWVSDMRDWLKGKCA